MILFAKYILIVWLRLCCSCTGCSIIKNCRILWKKGKLLVFIWYSVSKTTRSKVSKNRNQRKLIAAVAAKTNMHFFFLLTIPMNKRISTHQEAGRYRGVITLKKTIKTERRYRKFIGEQFKTFWARLYWLFSKWKCF